MACSTHLENQIEEKVAKEGVDALSEDERKVYEADEDEAEDLIPDEFGPNSDEWDGDYCDFCYSMGKIGAVSFGALVFLLGLAIAAGLQIYGYGLQLSLGVVGGGVVLGFIVWFYLRSKVKKKGYFPVLGPKLGPIVEEIAAERWDVYLTPTARLENGEVMTDGGTQAMQVTADSLDPEEVDEHYDDHEEILDQTPNVSKSEVDSDTAIKLLEENQELRNRLRQEQQRAEKHRELADTKQEKFLKKVEESQKKSQRVNSIEEVNEELKEENKELSEQLEILEKSYDIEADKNVEGYKFKFWIPHPNEDACVGPFYCWDIVQYDHPDFRGTIPLPLATTTKHEQIPDYTQTISENQYPKYEDYLFPDPKNIDQPPATVDRHHQKYDEQEDNPLFLGSIGQVEDLINQGERDTEAPWTSATLTLGYDLDGNPVHEGADDSGRVRELENKLNRTKRKLREKKQQMDRLKRDYEDLEHKKDIAEDKLDDAERKLNRRREEYDDLLEDHRAIKRKLRDHRDRADMAEDDKEHYRDLAETRQTQAKNIQKKQAWESAEHGREVEKAHNHEETVRNVDDVFQRIRRSGWNADDEIEMSRVGNEDYQYTKEDVFRMFMDDPQADPTIKQAVRGLNLDNITAGGQ